MKDRLQIIGAAFLMLSCCFGSSDSVTATLICLALGAGFVWLGR